MNRTRKLASRALSGTEQKLSGFRAGDRATVCRVLCREPRATIGTRRSGMARLREGLLGSGDTSRLALTASDTSRPLGSLEHLFWLLDQHRSVHFAVPAEIAGKASPDDWRDALDRVQARHPILSVRIAGSPASVPRFRPQQSAPTPL